MLQKCHLGVLFDWALLCRGPLILDVTLFFPSVLGQGGSSANVLLPEYEGFLKRAGISFPVYCINAAAAFAAGFFAARAGKEPISILPRLRENQRMQLGPALEWMSVSMKLPKPPSVKFL